MWLTSPRSQETGAAGSTHSRGRDCASVVADVCLGAGGIPRLSKCGPAKGGDGPRIGSFVPVRQSVWGNRCRQAGAGGSRGSGSGGQRSGRSRTPLVCNHDACFVRSAHLAARRRLHDGGNGEHRIRPPGQRHPKLPHPPKDVVRENPKPEKPSSHEDNSRGNNVRAYGLWNIVRTVRR